MTFHPEYLLDETGWRILQELQQDARLSFHELGRRRARAQARRRGDHHRLWSEG